MTTNAHVDHRPQSSKSNRNAGQVRKLSKNERERAKTLEKLRTMVGSENCTQLELMQRVIDYICHLRDKLTQDDAIESSEGGSEIVRRLTLQHAFQH
ncbi:Myc-type, basic helix-loop-helix (bHLH) domain-containing protein [Aphelenchoides besseyi]|nr:Myc-type, basic helix-loop-helix (bHLH) domain-containing protein [Aphelenchoides besseyi]